MKKRKRKGISLIVLVITIIVIIILAAAIILTLNKNNPMEEANRAKYESDRYSMQAIFTNAVAKVMAKNQGSIDIKARALNSIKSGVSSTIGETTYILNNPEKSENRNGKIIFDNKSNTEIEYYTGRKLPIYNAGETTWYVDEEGVITLQVGEKIYNGNSDSDSSIPGNIISYDINFPNKWPTNLEVYLGNYLYGYRFTGIAPYNDCKVDIVCSSSNQIPTIINFGGQINVTQNDPVRISAHGYLWNSTDYLFPTLVTFPNTIRLQISMTDLHNNVPYDIWCVYSK